MIDSDLPNIIIELPEDDSSSPVATPAARAGEKKAPSGDAEKLLKRVVSFAAVKGTVDKVVNYGISTVTLRTGAREYEQKLNFAYNTASQAVGLGVTAGMLALSGHPLLAVAGLAIAGISKGIEIWKNTQRLETEENRENISIQKQIIRAGALTRRGMGD